MNFDFTHTVLEPMIYRTRDGHANRCGWWISGFRIIGVHVQLTPRSICIVGMQSRCINQSGKQEEEH